jgi:hypothetical protein
VLFLLWAVSNHDRDARVDRCRLGAIRSHGTLPRSSRAASVLRQLAEACWVARLTVDQSRRVPGECAVVLIAAISLQWCAVTCMVWRRWECDGGKPPWMRMSDAAQAHVVSSRVPLQAGAVQGGSGWCVWCVAACRFLEDARLEHGQWATVCSARPRSRLGAAWIPLGILLGLACTTMGQQRGLPAARATMQEVMVGLWSLFLCLARPDDWPEWLSLGLVAEAPCRTHHPAVHTCHCPL